MHRAHLPIDGLKVLYCLIGFHLIEYVPPRSFILHTSLDRDVSLLYFLCVKDFLWFPNLPLKGGSDIPLYFFSPYPFRSEEIAPSYKRFGLVQAPGKGHSSGF